MEKAQQIKTILKAAGSRYVTVNFTKKNGELRAITFNPRFHLETKGTGSPRPSDLFTVVDSAKTKWRSFRSESVLSIKANGQVHTFA